MIPYTKEFESLIESLPVLVWTKDPAGRKEYFNSRWTEYSGLEANRQTWDWTNLIHPDEHNMAVDTWDESLRTGQVYEFQCRLKNKYDEYRWHVSRAIPVFDDEGNLSLWVGTCTDIQDIKSKEEELQKINTDLDNFVYMASHDLKAPISNLEGLVNMLKNESPNFKQESEDKMVLDMIDKSILQLKKTIIELTEISKVQRLVQEDIKELSLSSMVREIISDLQSIIKISQAEVVTDIQIDKFTFSERNMRSILFNLMTNAIKFKNPLRTPVIKISSYKKAQGVVLSVSDNGIGIDLSKGEKLFLMFKRLNANIEGAGVGLYIVKRIVENAGGTIEVKSKIGVGSEFIIFFP